MSEDHKFWAEAHFERCRPWIEDALARDIGTHTIEDVRALCEKGIAQLWARSNSVMVTTIEHFPSGKVLRGWLAGGDLKELQDAEPFVADWARKNGCKSVVIGGRRGWARAFDGYREAYTVMVKDLAA